MRLIKSKHSDSAYLSKIVNIKEFRKHNNPEVTKLKCCEIDGFNIIVGIDYDPGLYVYFPALSMINSDFLSYANLFRHSELNSDPTKTGMFENNCRVKAVKLKGEISEGFIIPLFILENYIITTTGKELKDINENEEFDSVEDEGKTFWISKKYIVGPTTSRNKEKEKRRYKVPTRLHLIREDQFRFHYDTAQIKKYPFILAPDQLIHISSKWHGTSGISAYVLCHKELNWKEKIAKFLTGYNFDVYDYIWASRSVIKSDYYNNNIGSGFYDDKMRLAAHNHVKGSLIKGMTYYYEIVGYDPTGKPIQKQTHDFDYWCVSPDKDEYVCGKHFDVRIYRITLTNPDGIVHEFSTQEVIQWCNKVGLNCVNQLYYGYAKDLYPELDVTNHWNEEFINKLANDKRFYMELDSPDCRNKVPHEGIVIKIEDGKSRAFKLKCFRFINDKQQSMDKGIVDTEDIS